MLPLNSFVVTHNDEPMAMKLRPVISIDTKQAGWLPTPSVVGEATEHHTRTLYQLALAACRKRKQEKKMERNGWKSRGENLLKLLTAA